MPPHCSEEYLMCRLLGERLPLVVCVAVAWFLGVPQRETRFIHGETLEDITELVKDWQSKFALQAKIWGVAGLLMKQKCEWDFMRGYIVRPIVYDRITAQIAELVHMRARKGCVVGMMMWDPFLDQPPPNKSCSAVQRYGLKGQSRIFRGKKAI